MDANGAEVGDTLRLEFTTNSGFTGSTIEDHVLTSDDVLSFGDPLAPVMFATFTGFASGATVYWHLRVVRGATLSAWSNTLNDTMAAVATFDVAHRRSEFINLAYGAGPAVPATAIAIDAGDKIQVAIFTNFNGGAITGITANSGAITFTSIGSTNAGTNEEAFLYYADTTGVTSLNLSVAMSGSTRAIVIHVTSIKSAAAGGPTASYFERRPITNEGQHDIDGPLTLPANAIRLLSAGANGEFTWSGAIEIGEAADGSMTGGIAKQTVAGNVTVSGPAYTNLLVANSTWSPA